MKTKVYFGVDGGGTKTILLIYDINYNFVAKHNLSDANINFLTDVEFEQLIVTIKNILDDYEIIFGCFGMPGYNESQELNLKIKKIIGQYFENYFVCNDVQIAHFGSLAKDDGIHVVAGTGSIALLQTSTQFKRIGGYGPLIGDQGSGFTIGKSALEYLAKHYDFKQGEKILVERLEQRLKIYNRDDLINYVYQQNYRNQISKASKVVDEALVNGSLVAKEIMQAEVEALVQLVLAYNDNTYNVSYSGSVFKSAYILEQFTKELNARNIKVIAPQFSAEKGAILQAVFLSGVKIEQIKQKFMEEKWINN